MLNNFKNEHEIRVQINKYNYSHFFNRIRLVFLSMLRITLKQLNMVFYRRYLGLLRC